MGVTQVNSHILYTLSRSDTCKKMKFAEFKDLLVDELTKMAGALTTVEMTMTDPSKCGRESQGTETVLYQGVLHLIDFDGADVNCAYGSTPRKRKRTSFYGTGYSDKPHLCPKKCLFLNHKASQWDMHLKRWLVNICSCCDYLFRKGFFVSFFLFLDF